MTITVMAVKCEYRDGMVIVPMATAPIETRTFEARNAQEVMDAAKRLQADFDQTHDAVIRAISYGGRKVAGFDSKVKPFISSLYCHRNPIWETV